MPAHRPAEERFWEKVMPEPNTGCWLWLGGWGAGRKGQRYGMFNSGSGEWYAHRFSYRLHRGEIPAGLVIDHLCRNRVCVNPDHMEIVTQEENKRRGTSPCANNERKTHCKRGHPLVSENLRASKQGRACAECARMHDRLRESNPTRQRAKFESYRRHRIERNRRRRERRHAVRMAVIHAT